MSGNVSLLGNGIHRDLQPRQEGTGGMVPPSFSTDVHVKKGVYPLLFRGEEFIGRRVCAPTYWLLNARAGDKDQVEELNEMGQLSRLLGSDGGE